MTLEFLRVSDFTLRNLLTYLLTYLSQNCGWRAQHTIRMFTYAAASDALYPFNKPLEFLEAALFYNYSDPGERELPAPSYTIFWTNYIYIHIYMYIYIYIYVVEMRRTLFHTYSSINIV